MSDIQFHAMGPTRARSGEDPLIPFLLNARGKKVTVSARQVGRLDSHRLQVLLVARRQWASEGVPFAVTDTSPAFGASLERMGLPSEFFENEVKA
ncbi:MAG: STAS domain-containing protein [Bacteroidetes bacterium]|jgi:anti-anti-sigma regulatory factor|nr:STAS domain-containing protein [Bacteroidota bacterium]